MSVDSERVIRDLYAARARSDMDAVRSLLAEDIRWHEPGDEDFSGDHIGRDTVLGLLERLRTATGGTFTVRPTGFLASTEHVVAQVRWAAHRGETSVSGNEMAVYRIRDGLVAEAWFYLDDYDPAALTEVLSFTEGS